ncbi:ribosome-assembly protein 3-domain-containing protein [Apodospora peruviana]|uniref:Ribosome assembly protein 3 n=1 Tax=Apodospora peruviana TaxID=516989 RepID=A0AAE0HWA5_9PEZI|nr:ribosome-assembly protein 3-domain-containing protein [Apodospora peruviana]
MKMAENKSNQEIAAEFTSYYLQRVTKEFAEDLDKVRSADDFKSDAALPLLINALQQGTALFSPEEQRRIVTAEAAAATEESQSGKKYLSTI